MYKVTLKYGKSDLITKEEHYTWTLAELMHFVQYNMENEELIAFVVVKE